MPTFDTQRGLTLRWENERVTLEGERVKVLYPVGDEVYNLGTAKSVYDAVKAHYEARKKAYDDAPGSVEDKARAEGEVALENLTRKREIARGR